MPKQVFAAAAILFLIGGTPGLYAAEIDILKKAEQLPTFGPPRGKLTPGTAEALARELPDDRFVADGFPPTRLISPDGTQEPYVSVRVLKVVPWACPGFVDRRGLGIRVSGLTAFCPPLWGNLLVRPRASFRPGLHISDAVVSSGCQGRPARQRCGLPQCFQAAS